MPKEELSDLDLARGVSNGDEGALKNLYDIYADLLFAYIKHLLSENPHVVAEDIWQETLLSAIRGMASFRGDSRLFTWMCGIAKRKVADYRRQRKISMNLNYTTAMNNLGYLLEKNVLPEDYVIQEATRRHVVEVLGSIRPKYQKILIQRYIDGSRVGEIAKSIGKTYKATESLLSRARQAFKSSFIKLSKEKRYE